MKTILGYLLKWTKQNQNREEKQSSSMDILKVCLNTRKTPYTSLIFLSHSFQFVNINNPQLKMGGPSSSPSLLESPIAKGKNWL